MYKKDEVINKASIDQTGEMELALDNSTTIEAISAIHTVADLRESSGGPPQCIVATCNALANTGANIGLVAMRSRKNEKPVLPNQSVKLRLVEGLSILDSNLVFSSCFQKAIIELAAEKYSGNERDFRIVHDHGIWLASNLLSRAAARKLLAKLVVSPHGALMPWAMRNHPRRKWIAWHLLQRPGLRNADAFHVASVHEAEGLRELGLEQPIAIIPHGVEAPKFLDKEIESKLEIGDKDCKENRGRKRALFLSRISPSKGLIGLLDAWGKARPQGWELRIVGPDDRGHRAEIEERIRQLRLAEVSVHGQVSGHEKWRELIDADLFVLPTHTESFGIAVAEAMIAGLPVITTRAAPWQCLLECDGGWWIPTGQEDLTVALSAATRLSSSELRKKGENARAYALENLSWPASAHKHLALYNWLLRGGVAPDFVITTRKRNG